MWCPCGDNTNIVGYTNDDSGVIILDDAKQSNQSGSGAAKPFGPPSSTSMSQETKPSTSAACSSADPIRKDAQLSAEDKHSVRLSHNAQHVHARQVPGALTVSCDNHGGQSPSALLSQQLKPGDLTHGSKPSTKVPATVARCNPASSSDLVDLTLDESDSLPSHQPKSKRLRYQQHGPSQLAQTSAKPASEPVCSLNQAEATSALWTCSVCTLLNEDLSLQCSACGTVRPAGFRQGHLNTQSIPKVGDAWECNFCSLMNAVGSSHCSACAQWRYSYGAPHASRPTI